jgi:hypothetical protein
MRTRYGWLTGLLTVAVVVGLTPAAGWAQIDYTQPDHPFSPLPLYHDRPETGGFYAALEFLLLRQRIPLENQVLGVRGYFNGAGAPFPPGQGLFVGSGRTALETGDLGRSSYAPGFNIALGWKFGNDFAIEVSWWHLFDAKYASSAAGVAPFFSNIIGDETISAGVYNFAPEYGGPFIDSPDFTPGAGIGTGYGIWNGADEMTAIFKQRFDMWDITGRFPIYSDDCQRWYGLAGARFAWIWKGFEWRTADFGFTVPGAFTFPTRAQVEIVSTNTVLINGLAFPIIPDNGPFNSATYSNIVSNRMYGPFIGCGYEWYLGRGFAVSAEGRVAVLLDVVREIAKYELGDKSTQAKRSRTEYEIAAQLQGQVNLWWFPIEGVQMRVGYDLLAFFNTIYSPYPVAFDFGVLDPPWENKAVRLLDGFNVGLCFIF